ncbi:acyl-CoA carboxylase subunit epsilon [Streptomyces sp. NPDC012888]|uniref:acyl-CoA carboxylase subunit epsilon n=1 Tax=Streptomyces sp. NPDC012888 TaxID=3364855 RepID=UPI0036D08207
MSDHTREGDTTTLLRIVRGHASPEELAAITAVLTACAARNASLTAARPTPDGTAPGRRTVRRPGASHNACWAGCWTCR